MVISKCEYCNYDKDDYISCLDKQGHIFLAPYEHMLKIKYYGHKTQVEINYCPMCGRKLEEVKADEKENI